jgi:hypothetical protein
MFLQLLFSGLLFPRPSGPAVAIARREVSLWDLLPTTHLHLLLGRLLRDGDAALASPRLLALALLAALFVAVGGLLLTRAIRQSARA